MSVLVVDDLRLHYKVRGQGPAILIPWCNFAWTSLDVDLLADGYTLVIASPRGFGDSERVSAGYDADTMRTDLEAVLDHLGVEDYIAFGYSMTGSVAPWLAHGNPRVRAVISGGFPTVSSYASLLPYIEANLAKTKRDPDRWATTTREFDPDALLAWYHHLDTIPPGGLVDRLDCPVYCYWGSADEVIDELVGLDTLRSNTSARDIPFELIPGKDHEGMRNDINIAIPGVRNWLQTVVPPQQT